MVAGSRSRSAPICPPAGPRAQAGGRFIALYSDGGEYLAIDDTCPHQGASLGEGILHGGMVICPMHAWTFALRNGECPSVPELSVACYPTRVAGDAVLVELPEETA